MRSLFHVDNNEYAVRITIYIVETMKPVFLTDSSDIVHLATDQDRVYVHAEWDS